MDLQKLAVDTALFCLLAASLAPPSLAETLDLPRTVEVPKVHAPPAGNLPPQRLGDVPVPESKPGTPTARQQSRVEPPAKSKVPGGKDDIETPAVAPVPPDPPATQGADRDAPSPPEPAPPPDPRSAQIPAQAMPPAEIACRQRLQQLGVDFVNRTAERSDTGCSLPYPVVVRALGKAITLRPEAVMTCAMAEASARFAATTIVPAAKREFGVELKSVEQASSYVCRPRNGSRKLSEHAFGNALDIARFTLSDGKPVDVVQQSEDRAARFLAAVRQAACGPFKTVLGPGSDADHAMHFHLDLAPRRNGGTVCQ